MSDIFASPFFGITISILAFFIGLEIQKRTKIALCNPLLLAIILVIVFLKIFGISYDDYNEGGAIINMFLAPATACLAVSIYTKRRILKESWLPILVGCTVGCLASMGSVLVMCHLFGLDEAMTASLTPKSLPTAIGVSRRHRAGHGCSCAAHRYPGQHHRPGDDPPAARQKSGGSRYRHRRLQPRGRYLQSH